MQIYKIYKGSNLPNTFLVLPKNDAPENIVPFNLLYLFGNLSLTKGAVKASYLPFSKGSQAKLVEAVKDHGYCFYKWPGKILGSSLGELLDSDDIPMPMAAPAPPGNSVSCSDLNDQASGTEQSLSLTPEERPRS